MAAYHREDRLAHPEKIKERDAKWLRENPEKKAAGDARWARANPEKRKASAAKSYIKHRVVVLMRSAKRHREHPEKSRESSARSRAAHPERAKAACAKWVRANPEKNAAKSSTVRARKKAAPGRGVTSDQWLQVLADAKGICIYCQGECSKLTMDHVVPLALGGAHDIDNIVAACGSCNSSKGDTLLAVWLMQRELVA